MEYSSIYDYLSDSSEKYTYLKIFLLISKNYVPENNLCLRLEIHISTYNDMRHLCANRIIGTCRKSFLYIEKVEANLK